MYRIGIDIGGTNTDAVLVSSDNKILHTAKTKTTVDICSGFTKSISAVLSENKELISSVFAGTTHAINALLQAKDLSKVGVLRLAGHLPNTIPACFNWPVTLKNALFAASKTLPGGFNCDGSEITPLSKEITRNAINELMAAGAEGFCVTGAFSPLYPQQELQVRQWIQDLLGSHLPITLSHEIGGMGFIERENAAILNTALKNHLQKGFRDLKSALHAIDLSCPLLITKNDGTLMSLEEAMNFPVLTLAAGPKNSFIGGARLSGLSDVVVADIGGTSTDVGVVLNGFTRQSYKTTKIAGVEIGFAMPDFISIGLGGGSYLSMNDSKINIGPLSLGNTLLQKSKSFGGQQLTLTDAAIADGTLHIPNALKCIDKDTGGKVLRQAYEQILNLYQKMAGFRKNLPLIIVGGGASLLPKSLLDEHIFIPQHAESANAFGAALSEVGVSIQKIISLNNKEAILEQLEEEALTAATKRGASSPRIIERQVIPYYYAPQNIARAVITAAGSF
ncbi:MAG: hydantoinase/oxoprolinase family protein [Legionella sp.]|nr:hydantoinase/oxoprolinase family protein [Legionella sp.]